jgi:phytoene dehydrogenase-like protein
VSTDEPELDAAVVGAGPNGLTAAVVLARAGLRVGLFEAAERVGGGARTEALTEPGFLHDTCSAVHPLGAGSPVWRDWPLAQHGLRWLHPPTPLAHPMPDGSAVTLTRSLAETAAGLGVDERTYRRLVGPFQGRWDDIAGDVLRPLLASPPAHPMTTARFGLRALLSASVLARPFRNPAARGMLAGLAAHAIAPVTSPTTGGVALMFAVAAHDVGWPLPAGGSQAISDALAAYLQHLGGTITTGCLVERVDDLPSARAYLLDVSPRAAVEIAGRRLPDGYAKRLGRYRYGPAVFKVDYALDGPVPWRAEECRPAGTVHVGGGLPDIAAALDAVAHGRPPGQPFLITAQPSVVDPSRAPADKHVFWAYGHVPHGWSGDLTDAIEGQLERFAPGFRDLVRARATAGPAALEARDPNYVGGDIACGEFRGLQSVFRPVVSRHPYATPDPAVFLCSSATPPGPGVHGLCGYHAARLALRRVFGRKG